jgi:branched-chain amino acid transport system permease protein
MGVSSDLSLTNRASFRQRLRMLWKPFKRVPFLGWLVSALVAVVLEQAVGATFARLMGLPKLPVLFGFVVALKQPGLIPSTLVYVLVIYVLPIALVAWLTASIANRIASKLLEYPIWISALLHVGLLYITLHVWSGISDYRMLIVKLTLIAIMLTLSLNVVNGYMGEFSCSHPGFMAVGAYVASVFTVGLFASDNLFGPAILPAIIGPFVFPLILIVAGLVTAAASLLVAIPSFRTRGDYLAIISLAFMFIVKSLIENLEVLGGPRGLSSQPDYANLPTVFIWTILCIWIINNFVESILGKALNAVRDDEIAANAMSVNTRRTKMAAFMFAAFWAGVAGGLFAHVLRYVNPGTFDLKKLAEVLAMTYFGGLNSVYGSIVGAVGMNLLIEALRPLEIFKWIIIPILLILVMIFRPTGLVAFREFNIKKLIMPKYKPEKEVEHGVTTR